MRKHIFTLMALAATLCACNKEQMIESEVTEPVVEPSAPIIFTATMEDAPESKATFDNTARCAAWDVDDVININGAMYMAQTPGFSTVFKEEKITEEIRPTYVSSTNTESYNNQPAQNLVDGSGVETRWIANKTHRVDGVWNIVVSTGIATQLKTIKLWNADTQSYSGRRWKSMRVYGSASANGPWTEIESDAFQNMNLAINNKGLAGEIEVNAVKEYTYYKIDVLDNMGDDFMQMSDMKFVVRSSVAVLRPAYISSTNTESYNNQPASNLVDGSGVETRWIANKTHMVDGAWNIVVSTGNSTYLRTIMLWNADTQSYSGRRWKSMRVYGSASAYGPWTEIESDAFQNMNLAVNNKGLAGELEVNATEQYTYYKIDVLDNMGDDFMQMSDMKFVVAYTPSISAPYHAYFPSSLYNNGKALLPSHITETWVDGKFNMPMYAHSETPNLQFKNLCGVLKIIVKSDQIAAVKRLRVSSNQSLSGYFKVENDGAKLTEGSGSVTVTYNEPVTTTAEGRVFYVAVPPQTYDYLKIELDADGTGFTKLLTTKKGQNIVVERNKIYPVNRAYDSAISVSVTNQVDGPVVSNLIMRNTCSQNIYLRSMIVAAWYDSFGNFVAPWDISQGTFESLAPAGWTMEDGIYYCNSVIASEGCPAAPLFVRYTKPAAPAEGLHLEMKVMVQAIPYDSTRSCVDAFKSLN